MDNEEEIQGVKFSEFPSATPESSDEVVGLHSGGNARFSIANIILLIRQGLANIFVPNTRKVNNHALSSDVTLTASDVGARSSSWTPSASDVGAVPTTAVGSADGVASLGNDGKVPAAQLPPISAEGKADEDTIAPVETSTTATEAHPLGSTFYLESVLYRALSDIAIGGTINTGTGGNATQTTVAANFSRIVKLTAAQYAQLSAAEKAADIIYIVTDEPVPEISTATPQMDGTGAAGSTGEVSDAGHTHPSDTTKANQSQLAYVESGTTASRAYSIGEYFCHNGKTCRAKTAISSGATLTLNTNYEEESSGGLNALNSTMSHVAKAVVISNVEGKTIPAGSSFVSFTPPTGLPHKNLLSLSLYCIYANVYFQWCPQALNTRFVDANAMWNFNVNNLRGAAVTIPDFLCIAIYNED